MNYPHVEELHYRTVYPENEDYDQASLAYGETENFNWQLSKDQLLIQMRTHCATESEARAIVDQYLKAWEITAGLMHGPDNLAFKFNSSTIIGQPLSKENNRNTHINDESSETVLLVDEAHVSYDKFPPFPKNFTASKEVEMMFFRYKLYRQGRETLLSMAYWCLMVIEYSVGGRQEAADAYRVEYRILRKLLELCWARGDINVTGKLKGNSCITPLKPAEREWIRAVVKRLIMRAGEHAYDPVHKLPLITMADFPAV